MSIKDPHAVAASPLGGLTTVDEHGDEPMTSAQADELRPLCEANGVAFDRTLSRAAAAEKIAELSGDTGITPPRS